MLTHIHIQNFTLVKSLSLDFQSGLSVLTGETGAGKSIWVDAVGLAMGHRAEPNVIRQNTDRCDISLCFNIQQIPEARQWLIEHQLDCDNECILRRTISRDSTSRSTINGHPCPQHMIRKLSQLLVNIHSQHQHQTLLKQDVQRQRLDTLADNHRLLEDIKKIYHHWRTITAQLQSLKEHMQNRDSELSLLRYQLNELTQLSLQKNEWQEVTRQHQQLHRAKELISQLNQAIDLAVENEQTSAFQLLQQAIHHMETISEKDPELNSARELLNTAAIYLQEAGDELNQYRNHLDLSPENLALIEQRLTTIHDMARKHHVNPEDLLDVEHSLQQKTKDLENIDIQIDTLTQTQNQLMNQYQKLADTLSGRRVKTSKKLNQMVTDYMQQLGIEGGRFQVKLEQNTEKMSPFGNEQIHFEVSTNTGQDFQSLQKVISGGELSRIALALQVITAEKEATPTLIFDEVDVGIGGKTAEIVGKLLRELGKKAQVLCITHLPQVATQGHHHFKVQKSSDSKGVSTTIKILDENERLDELARMLGGSTITHQTLAHASEMLELASTHNERDHGKINA